MYTYLIANNFPVAIASFVDELIVDVPDKLVTILVAYAIFKGLPKSLTILYKNDTEVEKLD